MSVAVIPDSTHEDAHSHPIGWRCYLYSTNHKDIGTMCLWFAMCAGLIGGIFSVAIRIELQHPGLRIFTNTHTYNVFVTGHGLIMIFFTLMPAMMGGFSHGIRTICGRPYPASQTLAEISHLYDLSMVVQPHHARRGPGDLISEAVRAIQDAMPFLLTAKVIDVVAVNDAGSTVSEVSSAALVANLARRDISIDVQQLTADAFNIHKAIQSLAADKGTDRMVMGGYGHSKLREFILAGVTRSY